MNGLMTCPRRDHPRMCGEHHAVSSGPHPAGDHPRMCGEHLSFMAFLMVSAGSSPHVRGARHHLHKIATRHGIIPACAGSTFNASFGALQNRDHPRMCGEHAQGQWAAEVRVGLSPHVRGAHRRQPQLRQRAGIIPACAGSTCWSRSTSRTVRDHPRMCGEHYGDSDFVNELEGSSPHVRGARFIKSATQDAVGIIPACAGSTVPAGRISPSCRDHPRMCGEHCCTCALMPAIVGSSPHVRGAPITKATVPMMNGIIPACAGSTFRPRGHVSGYRDHPRMCGEHSFNIHQFAGEQGSSPHVRGARSGGSSVSLLMGIIPACAGSTLEVQCLAYCSRDHPRMCGEHAMSSLVVVLKLGSSPHVRGARPATMHIFGAPGIIPACAGSTFTR